MKREPLIFILDDDLFFGKLLNANLAKRFSNVHYFQKESEFFDALKFSPDIVILDHVLENMFGFEVIEQIRLKCGPKTSILYLSAQEHVHITIKALRSGAVDYYEKKSCALDDLIDTIGRISNLTNNFSIPLSIDGFRRESL